MYPLAELEPRPDIDGRPRGLAIGRTFPCDGANCPHSAGFVATWRFIAWDGRPLPVRSGRLCADCLNRYRGFAHGRCAILAADPLW